MSIDQSITPTANPAGTGGDAATESIGAVLDAIVARESAVFLARQPGSRAARERAEHTLAGGATSSWQIAEPQAVWVSHGNGPRLVDVDGNDYADFHGGYGVSLAGHAHPAITRAVRARVGLGTHFAQPVPDAIVVAEDLAARFDQPLWRFANSGTEATMDAVHLMRAFTGRDRIIKVEGCYHGHHDSVQVSVLPEVDQVGPPDRPNPVAGNTGIPGQILDLVCVVPFNDLAAVARVLDELPDQVAGMILEPIMMNAGVIHPQPGYLAGLRDLLHRHGALLAFDEVKTGLTTGPGGVTRLSGVTPDLVCLAKALGGGVSTAAIGGSREVMALIGDGRYEQVGTFNGNPLAMASARAMLTEVLTPAAYAQLEQLRLRMVAGIDAVIAEYGLPWRVITAGAKGCIAFGPDPIHDYRDFLRTDDRFGHAHWLVQHNGGVFLPPWGKVEQWLISVQHTDVEVDQFVANVDRFAALLRDG